MKDLAKRIQLVKSYEGQIRYCLKRIEKDKAKIAKPKNAKRVKALEADIRHFEKNIEKWQERIDKCCNGEPLDFLGKNL